MLRLSPLAGMTRPAAVAITASDRAQSTVDHPPALAERSGVVRILMQFQSKDLEHFRSLCYTELQNDYHFPDVAIPVNP